MENHKLLIFVLLIANFCFSQTESDTISDLKQIFIENIEQYKSKPLKNVLDNLKYPIKAYELISTNPSDFKGGCPLSIEFLKIGKIVLYLNDKEIVDILTLLQESHPINKKINKKIYITIELENPDSHPFWNNGVLETYIEGSKGNNWTDNVKQQLESSKYLVKNIEILKI
jgi:hypothetical protein